MPNATGDQWRNNSRKSEEMEPKQKEHPAVDVIGDISKVQCCKEQHCRKLSAEELMLLNCGAGEDS